MHISMKCSLAVHCLIFIYEYGEENRITSDLLSKSSGSNPVTIRNIMSALKKDGILTSKRGAAGGVVLACEPKEITLYRICMAVECEALGKLMGLHSSPSEYCPVGRNIYAVLNQSYDKVKEDLKKSLESITLEEMIENYHQQLSQEA